MEGTFAKSYPFSRSLTGPRRESSTTVLISRSHPWRLASPLSRANSPMSSATPSGVRSTMPWPGPAISAGLGGSYPSALSWGMTSSSPPSERSRGGCPSCVLTTVCCSEWTAPWTRARSGTRTMTRTASLRGSCAVGSSTPTGSSTNGGIVPRTGRSPGCGPRSRSCIVSSSERFGTCHVSRSGCISRRVMRLTAMRPSSIHQRRWPLSLTSAASRNCSVGTVRDPPYVSSSASVRPVLELWDLLC